MQASIMLLNSNVEPDLPIEATSIGFRWICRANGNKLFRKSFTQGKRVDAINLINEIN